MLVFKLSIKFRLELGVVVQACNPSTQAAEAGGLECSSLATLGYMKLCLQKEDGKKEERDRGRKGSKEEGRKRGERGREREGGRERRRQGGREEGRKKRGGRRLGLWKAEHTVGKTWKTKSTLLCKWYPSAL